MKDRVVKIIIIFVLLIAFYQAKTVFAEMATANDWIGLFPSDLDITSVDLTTIANDSAIGNSLTNKFVSSINPIWLSGSYTISSLASANPYFKNDSSGNSLYGGVFEFRYLANNTSFPFNLVDSSANNYVAVSKPFEVGFAPRLVLDCSTSQPTVNISWDAYGSSNSNFTIWRSPDNVSYTNLNLPVNGSAPGYIASDNSVSLGGTYYYYINEIPIRSDAGPFASSVASISVPIGCSPLVLTCPVTAVDAKGNSVPSNSIFVGDTVTFTMTASGATGQFTYTWDNVPDGQSTGSYGPTSARTYALTPVTYNTAGPKSFGFTVTSSLDGQSQLGTCSVNIQSPTYLQTSGDTHSNNNP